MIPSPDGSRDLTQAVLRPARGYHAFEACVEQLATTIRLGVYPRGSMLPPERELAQRLHVSRSTLREAMAALRQAGLVETTRGRGGGTVVTLKPRTPSGRAAARVPAARRPGLAGRPRLPADRRARRRPHGRGRRPGGRGPGPARPGARRRRRPRASPPQHRQADSRFHLTVATLTGSVARDRGGHLRPVDACTRCCWRSPCSRPTSPTPTGSTPRWCGRSWQGNRTGHDG